MKRLVLFSVLVLGLLISCNTDSFNKPQRRMNRTYNESVTIESTVLVSDQKRPIEESRLLAYKVDTNNGINDTIVFTLDPESINCLKSMMTGKSASTNNDSGKPSIDRISFVLFGLILVLFVFLIIERKRRITLEDTFKNEVINTIEKSSTLRGWLKFEVIEIVKKSDQLKNWRDESAAKPQTHTSAPKSYSYENEIDDLQNRIAALEEMNRKAEQFDLTETNPVQEVGSEPEKKCVILYADFIEDGYFSKVKETPDDDTNFELHLDNEKAASFIISQSAYPRIARNPAGFLQGCDKQVLGYKTINIPDAGEGRAIKDENGKWRITKRIKVIIN